MHQLIRRPPTPVEIRTASLLGASVRLGRPGTVDLAVFPRKNKEIKIGASLCDMLQSGDTHQWSPDGQNWQTLQY